MSKTSKDFYPDTQVEERSGGSDTDSEIMRLRERKEELERARRTEAARARRAQREILNEVLLGVKRKICIWIILFGRGSCH